MCDFCKFSYGTADTVVRVQDNHSLKRYATHEIRPLINGKHIYFIRAFNEDDELIHKSSLYIENCPMCGRELISNKPVKFPVLETNKDMEVLLNCLGVTAYKEDGSFKGFEVLLEDIIKKL